MVLIGFAQNAMNKFKYSFCEKYLLLKEVCKEVNSTFFTHLCDLCISLFEKYICTDVTEINLYKSYFISSQKTLATIHGFTKTDFTQIICKSKLRSLVINQ